MNQRRVMLMLPIVFSLLLNPFVIYQVYLQTLRVPITANVELIVDQTRSGFKIESGKTVTGRIAIETLNPKTLEFEKTPDLTLEIDGQKVSHNQITINPGIHEIRFEIDTPSVNWPEKLHVLSYREKGASKENLIQIIILPQNWYLISGLIQLSGIFPVLVGIVSIFNTSHLLKKHPKDGLLESAQETNTVLKKRLETSAKKMATLLNWIDGLLVDEPGLYEKALRSLPVSEENTVFPIDLEIDTIDETAEESRVLVKFNDSLFSDSPGGEA